MPPKSYAVFYHVWSAAGSDIWRMLVDEQLKRIRRSGLIFHADIYCCISGPQHAAIREFLSACPWLEILHATADESNFEGETLCRLYDTCKQRMDLKAVAYVHTKGIRHFPDATPQAFRAVNSWRHFMEWGTIDRWRDAVARLDAADAVGVNFRTSPWPHFSGNFWWARPAYVRSLVRPAQATVEPAEGLAMDATTSERINYEKWLGTNQPRVFSFYDFPFRIPGQDWTYGFEMYKDDIYPFYEQNGM